MTAIDVQDRRRRVVFDGHPKFNNLAGFANYAAHRVANAVFEDQGKVIRPRSATCRTDVVLKAWARITAGQEIRVDNDMGVAGKPFRAQMLKR
eukprot:1797837-Prymnesium_polylepis.1